MYSYCQMTWWCCYQLRVLMNIMTVKICKNCRMTRVKIHFVVCAKPRTMHARPITTQCVVIQSRQPLFEIILVQRRWDSEQQQTRSSELESTFMADGFEDRSVKLFHSIFDAASRGQNGLFVVRVSQLCSLGDGEYSIKMFWSAVHNDTEVTH